MRHDPPATDPFAGFNAELVERGYAAAPVEALPTGAPAAGTLTTTAQELSTICLAIRPFTSKHGAIACLRAVRLEARDGVVTATATNRCIAGHARGEARGDLPPILIDRRPLKTVLRAIRDRSGDDTDVTVSARPTVTSEGGRAGLAVTFATDTVQVTVGALPGASFPDLGALFAPPTVVGVTTVVAVQPRLFAPFVVARKVLGGAPMRLSFAGDLAPVRVEIGARFVGVLALVKPYAPATSWADAPPVPYGLTSAADLVEGVSS